VLIGNSIGGAAALRLAAAAPQRVAALVLENAGGLMPVDRLARGFTAAMARFFAAGARGAGWFPLAYGAYYRTVLRTRAAAEMRRRIVAAGSEMAPILRDAWRGFGAADADQRELAPRIACPVLVAWAARDRVIQLARCLPAIRRFPNARVRTFRAGHCAHLETPDEFEACLGEFLGELELHRTADLHGEQRAAI
jgi:4,5:9,10-diseco-3-hydroxy-5,9,17-trioxoandrosta-1(10),2-diene-4-oate hydrolase